MTKSRNYMQVKDTVNRLVELEKQIELDEKRLERLEEIKSKVFEEIDTTDDYIVTSTVDYGFKQGIKSLQEVVASQKEEVREIMDNRITLKE